MAKTKNGGYIMDEYAFTPNTLCIDCEKLKHFSEVGWICKIYPDKIPSEIWKFGKCPSFKKEEAEQEIDLPELLFDD